MTYVLDNTAIHAHDRFLELGALYDRHTFDQFTAVEVEHGWTCWDVGTGAGSAACDLARRGAHVWATDLDTRWTETPATVHVLTHDVTTDTPPATNLDLIHLRLLASHLPEWPPVLGRLVAALAPGGWLLVEELDPMHPYQPDPVDERDGLLNRVGNAFTAVLASRGGNPRLGRSLRRQLAAAGLVDVHHAGHLVSAHGGDHPAARLMRANVTQMAPQLREHGITPAELDAYLAAMEDPTTTFQMPTFWTSRGRKP